ncbi:MAG: hypothetical protein E3J21_17115 [Anaerolineales bacterium]|nr:MAG: hypothetical protein E3J21_17115 [Anaerolineales bacterium]
MSTRIAVQIDPKGLLIPRAAIREWLEQGVEVIKDKERIIIQPRSAPRTERERVLQILEASGLLVKPQWEPTSPPVSSTELAELAEKFSVGRPLSEIAIEEREERW